MLARTKPGKKNYGIDLLFLSIIFSFFYALGMGHPLFTPDEGRYCEIAREMVASGDFITPKLNGVVFFDKPILFYWLQASAIKLFGLKESALRFWPVLIGIFGCLVTYVSGRILYNRRIALLAALILSANPLYYGASHYANLDLEVSVFISTSLFCFLISLYQQNNSSQMFFILGCIFSAFAVLTKGLIGLLFPLVIMGGWVILFKRWNVFKKNAFMIGILFFMIITFPWFFLVQKSNPEFLHFFFVTQQFSRFLSQDHFNNQASSFYYLPIVFGGFFPWSVLLIQSLTYQIKLIIKNYQKHSKELFLLYWITFIFLFFSIPLSKTMGYILPIFPALALLVSQYINNNWLIQDRSFLIGIFFLVFLSLLLSLFCFAAPSIKSLKIFEESIPYLLVTAITFLISAMFFIILFIRRSRTKTYFYSMLGMSIILLSILSASASIVNQKSLKEMALFLKTKLNPADEVVVYYKYYQDLPIYLERKITVVADWENPHINKRDNWMRELWYGMSFEHPKNWLINQAEFWKRWNSSQRMYAFLYERDWNDFAIKTQGKMHILRQFNNVRLVEN